MSPAKATKQSAPPPPTGFTGEVPNPSLGQHISDKIRARRAARKARPKRPLVVVNAQQPRRRASRMTRQHGIFNVGGSRPTARKARRRPPRRGIIFGVFTVVVAATVLTAAAVEFASWSAATEMFFVAEGISAGTAWFFGDPNPPAKPPKAPRKPRAAGNPPKGSGGHKCGAPTDDGTPCNNPVGTAGEKCWRHPGGGAATASGPAAKPKAAGPKRTKKTAPTP
jgi:hypothetical protein